MVKKTVSIFAMIVVIAIKIGVMNFCWADYATFDPLEDGLTSMEQLSMKQIDALKCFDIIRDYVIYEKNGKITGYHPNYGGCFINSNNELVLQLKPVGQELLLSQLRVALNNDYPLRIQECKWSINDALQELHLLKSVLKNYDIQLKKAVYDAERNVIRISIFNDKAQLDLNDVLVIYFNQNPNARSLITTSDRKTGEAQVIVESNCMNEVIEPNYLNNTNYIYCGDSIYYYNNTYNSFFINSTVGICGTYSGSNCILTAGHVMLSGNRYLRQNSSSILSSSGLNSIDVTNPFSIVGDYCAAVYPAGFIPTNYVYTSNYGNSGSLNYYYSQASFPQGAIVHKYGAKTGYTAGVVSGTDYTEGNYPYYIENLVEVEPISSGSYTLAVQGDSGGPVWCLNSNSQRVLLGIVQGGPDEDNSDNYYLYTPVYLAVNAGFIPAMQATNNFS